MPRLRTAGTQSGNNKSRIERVIHLLDPPIRSLVRPQISPIPAIGGFSMFLTS